MCTRDGDRRQHLESRRGSGAPAGHTFGSRVAGTAPLLVTKWDGPSLGRTTSGSWFLSPLTHIRVSRALLQVRQWPPVPSSPETFVVVLGEADPITLGTRKETGGRVPSSTSWDEDTPLGWEPSAYPFPRLRAGSPGPPESAGGAPGRLT